MSKTIQKYLENYSEKEVTQLKLPSRSFEQAIVIPAFDEDNSFLDTARIRSNPNILAIIVVNIPSDSSLNATQRTVELLESLKSSELPNLLVVDRVQEPIEAKQGVGLARKIGTDLAVKLYQDQKVRSPWIRQTDADATLDENYFDAKMPTDGAVVFKHQHQTNDPQISMAISLYDAHMSYYVSALNYAGSPYAFPTLGSTIAIQAKTYAQVRGYPKRNAGEDFHLLNKVAKINEVHSSKDSTVSLAARISDRVPFGTGPSIGKIFALLEEDPTGSSYLSYDFRVFQLLRETLIQLHQLTESPLTMKPTIRKILDRLGFQKIETILHTKYHSAGQRQDVIKRWFDGLRTLRFIHSAETIFPKTSLIGSLNDLPYSIKYEVGNISDGVLKI
ncbi:MAG: hypothetical protein CBE21_08565 [Proteobacteria bacterium TMED261]|nr:MAG: hypothetical protein CBE21_08565 [Proteobacteria bacterium TMED261]